MSVGWDPRSYLADAATSHIMELDSESSATTIVNYYDYIANHMESADRSGTICSAVEAQDEMVMQLRGVAMCVPYVVSISLKEATTPSRVKAVAEKVIEEAFNEGRRLFGHDPDSVVSSFTDRSMIELSSVPPLLQRCITVGLALTGITNGLFSIQCRRLMKVYDKALAGTTVGSAGFVDPSDPSSVYHGEYIDAVDDVKSVITVTSEHILKKKHMPFDLDAIAKGAIVDLVAASIAANEELFSSIHGCLVDWGGDLVAVGSVEGKRGWRVGILKPPRLDDLYRSWTRDRIDEVTPKEYIHSVSLGGPAGPTESVSAIATSGDYRQVRRFGFTHIVDPRTMRPTKARGQTIASSSVCSSSALMADALSLALFLCQRIPDALRCAIAIRNPDQPLRPHLQKYFLYARCEQRFVHDEGDSTLGEGDLERLCDADHKKQTNSAVRYVEKISRRFNGTLDAVIKSQNADAFHHASFSDPVATGDNKSALITSRFAESEVEQQLKRCCGQWLPHTDVIVTTAHMGAKNSEVSVMFTQISSVVPCQLSSEGLSCAQEHLCTFNVMRSSSLYNHVCAAGQHVVLNFLTADALEDPSLLQRTEDHVEWARENRWDVVHCVSSSALADPNHAARKGVTTSALAKCSVPFVAVTRSVELCGDHVLVVAQCYPATLSLMQAQLIHRPMLTSFHSRFRGVLEGCSGRLVSPALFVGTHKAHGSVGFCVYGVRMCSEHPLMLSLMYQENDVTQSIVGGGVHLASGDCTVVFPRWNSTLFGTNVVADDLTYLPVAADKISTSAAREKIKNELAFAARGRLVHSVALRGDSTSHTSGVFFMSVSALEILQEVDEASSSFGVLTFDIVTGRRLFA